MIFNGVQNISPDLDLLTRYAAWKSECSEDAVIISKIKILQGK